MYASMSSYKSSVNLGREILFDGSFIKYLIIKIMPKIKKIIKIEIKIEIKTFVFFLSFSLFSI